MCAIMKYSIIISALLATILLPVQIKSFDFDENKNNIIANLPTELTNTNITLDDAKLLLKEKCKKITGNDEAYDNIEKGVQELMECVNDLINTTAVQKEIEIATPIGELDTVFHKYCEKRPDAIKCLDKFHEKFEYCLDDDEKKNSGIFMRVVQSLLNFVCYKGGDQIALFIAEKGPECLESNKDVISNCINSTFSDYVPKNITNPMDALPQFVIGPKQCKELLDLEICVVNALEKCEEITPANIIESMFRFIKNETMCPTTTSAKAHKLNGGGSNGAGANKLELSILGLLILCFFQISFNFFKK